MRNYEPMFRLSDRQEAILSRLESEGRVRVALLSEEFSVSDVTIRKDLQELERLSLLKRVHGGATNSHRSKYNLPIGEKIGRNSSNKLAIAQAALELIHEGDTLIIDAGSTALALARLLPGRVQGLTVLTNSLTVIAELSQYDDFDVLSLGGTVRQHSLALIGPITVASLSRLHADLAFLGATGASVRHGLCTPNVVEAETKAAMVAACSEAVALVDHSKIGEASLASFASWEEVSRLVTDRRLPRDMEEHLRGRGVEVAIAGPLTETAS